MSKEAMKLALEALEPLVRRAAPWGELDWLNGCKAITALREALEKPDFWEGYVPEPVKPAQDVTLIDEGKTAQRTWEEWFKWWRTSKVADSTEAEIDFADFMLIVRAVEAEYGIKENT